MESITNKTYKSITDLELDLRKLNWYFERIFCKINAINKFEEGCSKKQADSAFLNWWNTSRHSDKNLSVLHTCSAGCLLAILKREIWDYEKSKDDSK